MVEEITIRPSELDISKQSMVDMIIRGQILDSKGKKIRWKILVKIMD
jgi:hypothetical protein